MSWFKVKQTQLTRKCIALDSCYNELEAENPSTDRYSAIVANIVKLESVPVVIDPNRLNRNTLWTLVVYTGLTLTVVIIEIFGHSLTSRALNASPFKPRL